MVMYDFNDGTVVLDYTNGRFTIYKNGELHETGWDDEQQQNPMLYRKNKKTAEKSA